MDGLSIGENHNAVTLPCPQKLGSQNSALKYGQPVTDGATLLMRREVIVVANAPQNIQWIHIKVCRLKNCEDIGGRCPTICGLFLFTFDSALIEEVAEIGCKKACHSPTSFAGDGITV